MSENREKYTDLFTGQSSSSLMTCHLSPFSHTSNPSCSVPFLGQIAGSPPLPTLPQSLSFPDYTRHMKQLKTVYTHSFEGTDNHLVSANLLHLHECCDDDRNCTYLHSCTSLSWNVSLTMQILNCKGCK